MPHSPHLRSVPVDITDPEMAEIFQGMALYNTGAITLAYRVPFRLRRIIVGNRVCSMLDECVDAGERVTFEIEALR